MTDNVIPVVFATNTEFVHYVKVAVYSLILNSKRYDQYRIYILYDELELIDIESLEKLSTDNVIIKCKNVTKLIDTKLLYIRPPYTREIYFRLFIPSIFPEYDKMIYLDSDIVLMRDISDLYQIELSQSLLGAIEDLVMKKKSVYFNSGVLLLNTKLFREEEVSQKCFDYLMVHRKLRFPDQDTLNDLCKNRILLIDERWNHIPLHQLLHSNMNQDNGKTPYLIHYAGPLKPENIPVHQSVLPFWRIAEQLKLTEEILDKKYGDSSTALLDNRFALIEVRHQMRTGKLKLRNLIGIVLQWFKGLIRRKG